MTHLQALILGLVQGVTEFLPISSSGHLVLVPWLLGWPSPGLAFDAFLHLGTMLAVLIYFREDLWGLAVAWLRSIKERRLDGGAYRRLSWLILLGTIPAAIAGFALQGFFQDIFARPQLVPVFLLVTALLLSLGERVLRRNASVLGLAQGAIGAKETMERLTLVDALLIGLAQAVAILPGVSRSGATMSAGLWRGLSRAESARFSFLLSVPVVAGAGLLKLGELWQSVEFSALAPTLALGFIAALGSGYLAIRLFLAFLKRNSLYPFIIYSLILGAGILILSLIR